MSKIASTSTMKHSFLIRYILFICIIGFICFLFFFRNIPIKGLFEGLVDLGDPSTNHNVNQPINTTYQCSNMCGPLSRCSITGEQCTSDVDCTGCQPKIQPQTDTKNTRGQNDAGKLTTEQTPTYSTLTTDIGTQATLYNKLKIPPTTYNKGLNTWRSSFDVDKKEKVSEKIRFPYDDNIKKEKHGNYIIQYLKYISDKVNDTKTTPLLKYFLKTCQESVVNSMTILDFCATLINANFSESLIIISGYFTSLFIWLITLVINIIHDFLFI